MDLNKYQREDNLKSWQMMGLQGYKYRGVSLEAFSTGFNPLVIEDGGSIELMKLDYERKLLNLIFALMTKWYEISGWIVGVEEWPMCQFLLSGLIWVVLLIPLAAVRELGVFTLLKYRNPNSKQELCWILSQFDKVPNEILLVVNLRKFSTPPPPPLPEPYLTSDKKLRIPTEEEIDAVLILQREYLAARKLFQEEEMLSKLKLTAKLITCSVILRIKSLKLYEPNGELWQEENFSKLLEFIKFELLNIDTELSEIRIINFDLDKRVSLTIPAVSNWNEVNSFLESSASTRSSHLTVSLLSRNQSPLKIIAKELQRTELGPDLMIDKLLVQRPDLIITSGTMPHFYQLYGLPLYPNDSQDSGSNTSPLIYTHHSLSVKVFIKSLVHWQDVESRDFPNSR